MHVDLLLQHFELVGELPRFPAALHATQLDVSYDEGAVQHTGRIDAATPAVVSGSSM